MGDSRLNIFKRNWAMKQIQMYKTTPPEQPIRRISQIVIQVLFHTEKCFSHHVYMKDYYNPQLLTRFS